MQLAHRRVNTCHPGYRQFARFGNHLEDLCCIIGPNQTYNLPPDCGKLSTKKRGSLVDYLLNYLFSDTILKVLIFGSAFIGTAILTFQVWPDEDQAAVRRRLGVSDEQKQAQYEKLLKWFRPFYSLLVPFIASKELEPQRKKLRRLLLTANLQEEIGPDEFIAFKGVMTIFFPILAVFLTGALEVEVPILAWPIIAVLGFYFPDLWVRERIKIRRQKIIRALPYTLDLLTLSVEAGLDFIAAIQRLVARSRNNALLTEFNQMLKEIRLGTSRSDALRTMSDRLHIEEITSLSTLLIQADQLGASVGSVLRAQSDQMRSQRFQNAESAGARASQLVLFPLVLCIFPSIFIVVIGPTAIGMIQRGLM